MTAWTTLDLLATVKNRAMIPDASSGSLGSATILQMATEEMLITVVPMIMSVRERYYETYLDTTYTTATTSIKIPSRAISGTLTATQYLFGPFVHPLNPISPHEVTTTQAQSTPMAFYFENNNQIPYPPPLTNQGTWRQRYLQRPSRLEQTVNCAQVTAFDTTAKTVTCGAVPSAWSTSSKVDFIPQSAAQATPYALDQAVTSVSSNVLSFASLPSALAIGDWLALAEFTPIPEIPFEFQTVLAQATAVKALEALKDQPGLQIAQQKLTAYQQAAVLSITPRDQGGLKKVVSGWRRF